MLGVSRDATARVRAERSLEERERYLRSVVDTALDGFWVVAPDGRIVDANPAACAMLGFTREELLERRVPDVEVVESAEETARHIRRVQEQGFDRFETSHRRKDGTVIRVAASVTRIEVGEGLMVCFLHDVTERRREATALERTRRTLLMLTRCSEAILRATSEEELFADVCRVIVETGGYRMCWVGVAENDARRTVRPVASAGAEEGYLATLDLAWADVPEGRGPTGTAIREGRMVVGHYLASDSSTAPWRSEAVRRGYASALALPISFEGETVGALSMYSVDAEPVGEVELRFLRQLADDLAFGVHALRQRSARVRADAGREAALLALSSEQDRFRALIEGSSDLTLVVDREGVIRFASPASREVIGYAPAELEGVPLLDHVHPEDHERAGQAMKAVLAAPGAGSRVELRVRRADGTQALVESGLRNLLDVPGVAGIVINNRDITERNRLREQFQQAQKLESVGRLAGGVAHDFNNLLTIILSCGEELRPEVEQGSPIAREYVDDIVSAGRRASDLTRQLLAFARKQVIAPEVVDLNALLRQSKKLLGRVIGEDVRVVESYQADLWPVCCDPGLLGQVVMNLAVNARDAMPRGGTLTFSTQNVELLPGEIPPDPEMGAGAEQAYETVRREQAPIDLLVTDVVMPGTGGREMARRIVELRPGLRVLYVSGYTHDAISRQGVLDEGIEFLPKPFTSAALLARVRAVLDRA